MTEDKEEIPCEENGCTDIDNCDEICQHSRIYSPVQMQQAIARATEGGYSKALDDVRAECMKDGKPKIFRIIQSLRIAQPEPTEREPE